MRAPPRPHPFQMKKITLKAPAKINLTLDILSKKPEERFHPLKTIYHIIDLCDEIEITESNSFDLIGDFDCPQEGNLITKAYHLIKTQFPQVRLPKVRVKVDKNIPAQGGLGGGSSNFAHFVIGYFKLFELGPIPEDLIAKSGNWGKDIPFFFANTSCALGTKYGEKIQPLDYDFAGQKIYLYFPHFKSSTAAAYQQLTNHNTNYTDEFLKDPNLSKCGNGFDEFLSQENYKKYFTNTSQLHLCGSGSTCFSREEQDTRKEVKVVSSKLV